MSESSAPAPQKIPASARVFIVLAVLALVLGGLWWWYNRPIRPVELSAQEKAVVEQKVEAIQKPAEPGYEKGSKEIILTERELNGLLHQNTTLGDSLEFELVTNAIHARIEFDLDPGLPIVGGKRLKARARFLVSGDPGRAALILDDLTVWGVSLPNDWLGGIKGQDLLGQALGGGIGGVEEFKVERGKLLIRLAE
ncbi:MAG: hypothetical protein EHM17_04980 [Verrucomicrobiaceae bacterium]|jgi:hypothetical protein|nr:MAG: hypothetical protein EHM17_04980 [Verrucomicrobiaceae bacterium]